MSSPPQALPPPPHHQQAPPTLPSNSPSLPSFDPTISFPLQSSFVFPTSCQQAPDPSPDIPPTSILNESLNLIQLHIQLSDTPKELHHGFTEIAKFSPHSNITLSDTPLFPPNSLKRKKENLSEKSSLSTIASCENPKEETEVVEWLLSFHQDEALEKGEYKVQYFPSTVQGVRVTITYNRTIEAFKALGRLMTLAFRAKSISLAACQDKIPPSEPPFGVKKERYEEMLNFREKAQFETLCLMVDCSRNAVTNTTTLFQLLRFISLMGYNMIQLYTEDTYEIKDEPYFGFYRGGYTQQELSEIDDYAFSLGIEVVPCIQTLGHLGQILQWPHYANLKDTNEVLLTRFNETYLFIEKMIEAVSTPLRSTRIHLGMDEAYGLGEGRYRQFFGSEDHTKIFMDHLSRIREICDRLGLRPMIWSDRAKNMSLASYYDENIRPAPIPMDEMAEQQQDSQSQLDLVFWDYYHTRPATYQSKLRHHRDLGCANPWMAGGAWTWSRFWCASAFSLTATKACLKASMDPVDGVNQFMLTLWGDEGSECDYFSALPIMLYTSLTSYSNGKELDVDYYSDYFTAVCGANLHAWYRASQLDELPFDKEFREISAILKEEDGAEEGISSQFPPNPSKHLLWEDPFYGILGAAYSDRDLETHYTQLAQSLTLALENQPETYPFNYHLLLPINLAQTLSHKVHLHSQLIELYQRGQKSELLQFATHKIPQLKSSLTQLWHCHRNLWHNQNKPFGWEVLELRYGGLLARLDTLMTRVSDYCDPKPVLVLSSTFMPQTTSLHDPDSMDIDIPSSCGLNAPEDNSISGSIIYTNAEPDVEEIEEVENTLVRKFRKHSGLTYPSPPNIPEFDISLKLRDNQVTPPFTPSRHNMIIEYSRASSVSRLG